MKKSISIRAALRHIRGSYGRIFSVRFVKRTTGELREMVCRQGVKSHLALNPSRPGIDFKANRLLPVFDMALGEYRSIPVEGIKEIRANGEWREVR